MLEASLVHVYSVYIFSASGRDLLHGRPAKFSTVNSSLSLHYKHRLHTRREAGSLGTVLTCPLYPGMSALRATRIQTSRGANNKCTFTNCWLALLCTHLNAAISPAFQTEAEREACAYSSNGYVHCFPRLSKRQTSGRC